MRIIIISLVVFLIVFNFIFAEDEKLVITLQNNEIITIDVNKIDSIKFDIINSIKTNPSENQQNIKNYPNPCRSFTTIEFNSMHNQEVQLTIFNIYGETALSIDNYIANVGLNSLTLELKDINNNSLPSGVYFCKILMGSYLDKHKIIILNED